MSIGIVRLILNLMFKEVDMTDRQVAYAMWFVVETLRFWSSYKNASSCLLSNDAFGQYEANVKIIISKLTDQKTNKEN